MKLVPVEGNKKSIAELAQMAKAGPIILTRRGKPMAAIKDLSGKDWESLSLANNPQFMAIIESSRRSYRLKGGIGIDQVRKELGLKARSRNRHNSRKTTRD
jgi:hypothetical protein